MAIRVIVTLSVTVVPHRRWSDSSFWKNTRFPSSSLECYILWRHRIEDKLHGFLFRSITSEFSRVSSLISGDFAEGPVNLSDVVKAIRRTKRTSSKSLLVVGFVTCEVPPFYSRSSRPFLGIRKRKKKTDEWWEEEETFTRWQIGENRVTFRTAFLVGNRT